VSKILKEGRRWQPGNDCSLSHANDKGGVMYVRAGMYNGKFFNWSAIFCWALAQKS